MQVRLNQPLDLRARWQAGKADQRGVNGLKQAPGVMIAGVREVNLAVALAVTASFAMLFVEFLEETRAAKDSDE